jgi:NADH-quinone oxidoreductase subunit I
LVKQLIDGIKNLVIGMMTTSKHLGRHAVTLQYPKEKWPMPERSRGIVVLLSDQETGELNCTVCMLCARACPTAAIRIEYEKDEKKKRQLKDFIVDYNLCCFCGLCEDVCNFAAIKLAPKYEFSTLDKNDLIWHTDKLQEMGRDVPYEKPVRKKAAAKTAAKPVPKPAAPKAEDKPVAEAEEKAEAKPTDKPAETEEVKNEEEKPKTEPVEKPMPEGSGEEKAGDGGPTGEKE